MENSIICLYLLSRQLIRQRPVQVSAARAGRARGLGNLDSHPAACAHGAGGPPATDSGGSMDPGSGSDRITNGSDVFGLLFTTYYQSGLSDRDKNSYPGPTLHQNFNI